VIIQIYNLTTNISKEVESAPRLEWSSFSFLNKKEKSGNGRRIKAPKPNEVVRRSQIIRNKKNRTLEMRFDFI